MLFDIDRSTVDGRTKTDYLDWARTFLSIFPGTIIFHDGSANELKKEYPESKFVQISIQDLELYKYRVEISNICSSYIKKGRNDLVYRLPEYGILVQSKFQLMRIAQSMSRAEYFMWVDIGLTRFLDNSFDKAELREENLQLNCDSYFEIDLKGNLVPLQFFTCKGLLRLPKIGTSKRVVGAGLFIVNNSYLSEFCEKVNELQQKWISRNLWDTEQVLLALVVRLIPKVTFHLKKPKSSTSILEIFTTEPNKREFPSQYLPILLGLRN
jgi:hypothetical protein